MSPELVHDLMTQAMIVTLKVCLPILLTSLLIGILISAIQALTQIQENTLSFVPKLLAMFAAIALSMNFMAGTLNSFTESLFSRIVQMD